MAAGASSQPQREVAMTEQAAGPKDWSQESYEGKGVMWGLLAAVMIIGGAALVGSGLWMREQDLRLVVAGGLAFVSGWTLAGALLIREAVNRLSRP